MANFVLSRQPIGTHIAFSISHFKMFGFVLRDLLKSPYVSQVWDVSKATRNHNNVSALLYKSKMYACSQYLDSWSAHQCIALRAAKRLIQIRCYSQTLSNTAQLFALHYTSAVVCAPPHAVTTHTHAARTTCDNRNTHT